MAFQATHEFPLRIAGGSLSGMTDEKGYRTCFEHIDSTNQAIKPP
jgi:hypothetical protein